MEKYARRAAIVTGFVLALGCGRRGEKPKDERAPSPSSSPPTAPGERPESAEPPTRDPSLKPPQGYRRMAVGGIAPVNEGNAVVLMDAAARRGLVLFVGGTEALSIALRLEQRRYDRPLTHDLLDSVVAKLGGDVVSARVDRLENDVFYGSVLITRDGRLIELDARPSDALALAIGNAVPLFVSESVLSQVGIDVDKFDFRKLEEGAAGLKVNGAAGEVEL